MTHTVAIIGTGPAGYAAATYVGRAEIKPIMFGGPEPGGQLMKTTEVENFPGFSNGVVGPVLMEEMRKQCERFGAEFVFETVVKINKLTNQQINKLTENEVGEKFQLMTDGGKTYEADAVILAMGARSKMLGIGEEAYFGKGFSTCAVCDAAFYREKDVYVVGGGDSAIEDAWALTKFAKSVTMIVRGDSFRASRIMQKRVTDNPDKIKVMWKTNLKAIKGERVEELVLDVDGVEKTVSASGLFFAIGHVPSTEFLTTSGVELDEKGYVKTGMTYPNLTNQQTNKPTNTQANQTLWGMGTYPTMTSIPGIFAGGDCVDFRYRQAATAAGMGVAAALDAEKWLEARQI